jgi:uncharacterized membrane protein YoaK (UPF0700 family)
MTSADAVANHIDNRDLGLALLGFASGTMDALAFLNLRQVFPSAMTGNTALLGVALGQGHLIAASRPLIAFAGFLIGAAVAAAGVDLWFEGCPVSRAIRSLLALEACLLAAFVVVWQFADRPIAGVGLYPLIVLASSAMGIQSRTARLIDRPGITTVVFTSTLTAIATAAIAALLRRPHRLPFTTKRQIGMFLIYAVGAVVGGLLAPEGTLIAFLPFVSVVCAAALQWRATKRDGSSAPRP